MDEFFGQVERIVRPVYLVGGSVRDILLGHPPKDYDFSTPLPPDDIEQRIRTAGKRPFITGKRFGTLGFKLGEHHIEITTFRTETYGKTRKPEVSFVEDITEDLSRRDFTINAIALRDRHYIDPFNGRQDLQNRLIRSVGQPALRFNEDPLRMLRAARFAAQLDFVVDQPTLTAIHHHGFKILNVSHERWMQEFDRLLTSQHPEKGLHILAQTDLIRYLVPELRLQVRYDQHSPYHELDLWNHSVSTLRLSPNHINIRWAALLHDVGKPFVRTDKPDRSNYADHELVGAQLVYGIGKRLRWSNDRIETVTALVRDHLDDEASPIACADSESRHRVFDD